MMNVAGLGGKKIKVLYEKLKIDSLESLKEACLQGKIASLKGFGTKSQKNILESIEHLESYSKRHLWWDAMQIASPILKELKGLKGVNQAEIAGSLRRKLETVGDLDFVISAEKPQPIMDWFIKHPSVEHIITHGSAKSSVRITGGIQAELRIMSAKQYAFGLLYSTGSKNHNIKLRQIANSMGLSLSEWALVPETKEGKDPFIKSKKAITEKDIYNVLGMDFLSLPSCERIWGRSKRRKKKAAYTSRRERHSRNISRSHSSIGWQSHIRSHGQSRRKIRMGIYRDNRPFQVERTSPWAK